MKMNSEDPVQRYYYGIEVIDHSGAEPTTMSVYEAETPEALGEKVAALATLGDTEFPKTLEVRRMANLDAPLSDEEQQNLDEFADALGSASDGTELDETLSDEEVDEELEEMDSIIDDALSEAPHPMGGLADSWQESEVPDLSADRLTPAEGGRWFDPDSNNDWGNGYVTVVEMPGDTAGEWPLPSGGTVASYNGCHSDEPVVVVTYEDGGPKQYAMPLSRLMPTCPACGPIEVEEVSGPAGHETCRLCGERIESAEL